MCPVTISANSFVSSSRQHLTVPQTKSGRHLLLLVQEPSNHDLSGEFKGNTTLLMPRKFHASALSRKRLLALPEVYQEAGSAFFIHKPTGLILRTSKDMEIVLPWFLIGSGKRVRTPDLQTLQAMWEPLYEVLMKQNTNVVFLPIQEKLISIVEASVFFVCSSCGKKATTESTMQKHGTCETAALELCLGFAICKDKETDPSRFVAFSPDSRTERWFQKNSENLKEEFLSAKILKKRPRKAAVLNEDTEDRNQKISRKSKSALKKTQPKKEGTKIRILKSKSLITEIEIPKSPNPPAKTSSEVLEPSSSEKKTRSSSYSSVNISPKRLYPQQPPEYQELLDRNRWIIKIEAGASTRLDHLENASSKLLLLDTRFVEAWGEIVESGDWLYLSHIILSGMKESINRLCKGIGGYECRIGMSWIEVIEARKKLSFKVELSSIVDEYERGWYAKVVVDSVRKPSLDANSSQAEQDLSVNFQSRQLDFLDLCQFMTTQTAFLTSLIQCCDEYGGRLTKDTVVETSWNSTRLPVDAEMATRLTKFGVATHLGFL